MRGLSLLFLDHLLLLLLLLLVLVLVGCMSASLVDHDMMKGDVTKKTQYFSLGRVC